ncbi:hypothetical protein F5Y00DRAFT_268142 [Daldinia vernicosa]|uniref:uncharacterized protein n=1 Tax=Daldinia vernicosa TaxID=114800 RepID=UPI0020085EC2|nr:uncharacterized protein F5Y00DRAFT_268142 [Daldinia vernicosa]KAI0850709.1 hypothetical protein F5Y00DRAFT_268142 [Daldinia vernicosa]
MQLLSKCTQLRHWLCRSGAKLLGKKPPEIYLEISLKSASSSTTVVPLRAESPVIGPREATPPEPPQITPPGSPTVTQSGSTETGKEKKIIRTSSNSDGDSENQSAQKLPPRTWPYQLATPENCKKIAEYIRTASARVRYAAFLGIQEIAEAQAGAATAAEVTHFVAHSIPYLLDNFIGLVEGIRTNDVDEIVEKACRIPSWPDDVFRTISHQPAQTVASYVDGSLNGPHAEATVTAIERAERRLVSSIADSMADHVLIPESTKWTLRMLMFTISAAACEAAFIQAWIVYQSAGDITLSGNYPPPPYTGELNNVWEMEVPEGLVGGHGGRAASKY